jgi:hypothetical protein
MPRRAHRRPNPGGEYRAGRACFVRRTRQTTKERGSFGPNRALRHHLVRRTHDPAKDDHAGHRLPRRTHGNPSGGVRCRSGVRRPDGRRSEARAAVSGATCPKPARSRTAWGFLRSFGPGAPERQETWARAGSPLDGGEDVGLRGEQLLQAGRGEVHETVHRRAVERLAFGRPLDLDIGAGICPDDIEVDVGP